MDTDREELLKKAKDLKYSPLDAEAVIKLAPMYTPLRGICRIICRRGHHYACRVVLHAEKL